MIDSEAGLRPAPKVLATGARRVVARHWCVEDRSTAELMGTVFERVVKAPGGKAVSYARALHEARGQKRWSSPAYWAPFVLIGTAE
jgi:CHAT domain-containing protein